MNPSEALAPTVSAIEPMIVSREKIPIDFIRTFSPYENPNSTEAWIARVRDTIEARFHVKLIKVRGEDAFTVSDPETHFRRAQAHGRKSLGQKRREIASYEAISQRADASEQLRIEVAAKRDKAAGVLTDMKSRQRLKDRLAKILEG